MYVMGRDRLSRLVRTLRLALISLLSGTLLCAGCKREIRPEEMLGSFQMKTNAGCGLISIRPDHNFHQQLSAGCSGILTTIDGKWSLESDDRGVEQISFAPFLAFDGPNPRNMGLTYLLVEKNPWSDVRIMADPANYEKMPRQSGALEIKHNQP